MSTFEVRVAGPDDVYRHDDELAALRLANAINQAFVADCLKNPGDMVLCVATVHRLPAQAADEFPPGVTAIDVSNLDSLASCF